ncbi:hypothetical protein [Nonomuraea sp. NPDC049400]|uniref:hypothetical protein n=1 Tax=Nonomuraea sp. NPDC049400 TaxID=3364352 RepID=UPI00378BF1A2
MSATQPLTESDTHVLAVVARGQPMRARAIAGALGRPDQRSQVEGLRLRLKRLVARGWLVEHHPGLFSLAVRVAEPRALEAASSAPPSQGE